MNLRNFWIFLSIFSILLQIFFFPFFLEKISTVSAIEVTPNTIVEEDDVVVLNYTLWVQMPNGTFYNETQEGTVYVHDPADSRVPQEIFDLYPEIHTPPCYGFFEGILGMRAGDTWSVFVSFISGKAFNNRSDPLYGENLNYLIHLQRILLDSSKPPPTVFDIPFFIPLVIIFGFFLFVIIANQLRRYAVSMNIISHKKHCYLCKRPAEIKCGNTSCNTLYCKKCFIEERGCEICQSNTMIPLK